MKETIFRALIILFAIGLIIIGISGMAKSQTVSFSPTSVPLWGSIEKTMKASVEYKRFELIAVKAMQPMYDHYGSPDLTPSITGGFFERPGEYSGYYFGLFYTPLQVEYKGFSFDAGGGLWNRKFPTKNGQLLHFTVSVAYQLHKRFSLSYEHKSNGFGIVNKLNPGADWLSLKYHF